MSRENIVKENPRLAGRLGGSKTSGRKRLAAALNARKRCAPSCPIFPCPFQPLAEGGECALKKFPDELRRRITHLYARNEEGVLEELRDVLVELGTAAKKDPKLLYRYFRALLDFFRVVYADRRRLGESPREVRIVWEDVWERNGEGGGDGDGEGDGGGEGD